MSGNIEGALWHFKASSWCQDNNLLEVTKVTVNLLVTNAMATFKKGIIKDIGKQGARKEEEECS